MAYLMNIWPLNIVQCIFCEKCRRKSLKFVLQVAKQAIESSLPFHNHPKCTSRFENRFSFVFKNHKVHEHYSNLLLRRDYWWKQPWYHRLGGQLIDHIKTQIQTIIKQYIQWKSINLVISTFGLRKSDYHQKIGKNGFQ